MQKNSIEDTLAERGKTYGSFVEHANIAQALKDVMRLTPKWRGLTCDKKQALEVIADKIGRILNGDPEFHDSWHDIGGYAKLVADQILRDAAQVNSSGITFTRDLK